MVRKRGREQGQRALDAEERPEAYDVLILDAAHKQSLASARYLGRAGLRVALGESAGQFRPHEPSSFQSRYCARSVTLSDYITDPAAYAAAVIAFAREHSVKVVIPTGDASIAVLAPYREQFSAVGCVLAVASDAALEIANDKTRTLEVASRLSIAYPKSVPVSGIEDLGAAEVELGYPFVLKPTISWTGKTADRAVPIEVIDEAEAIAVTKHLLEMGAGVLAQQWASGRREGVTLFIDDDEVVASCGHWAQRTNPALGGASVMRESILVSPELLDASVRMAKAIGITGVCEVEFRRDASGFPLLMEVNARLAGTLENALHSGVDFPLMIWLWATGRPIDPVHSYRTGVRTRWLHGDLRWLRENQGRVGRPDSVSRARALWTVTAEFARTRHYDYFDHLDIKPGLTELRRMIVALRKSGQ